MAEEIKKEVEETETEGANAADEGKETETDSEDAGADTEEASKETKTESPEAKRSRLERELKRHNKKHGFETEEKAKTSKQSDEFDDGQLAYLATRGITTDKDIDFTKEQLKERGGTLRELLGKKWFQSELTERKEAQSVLEATPTGSKRGQSRTGDTVEYEYAKYLKTGKLPADREMRTKVVNMRYTKAKSDSEFSD